MKTKSIINLITTVALLFAASTAVYAFDISAKRLVIENIGGERKFFLSCDQPWTLSSEQDWVSISPSMGIGSTSNVVITVKVQANTNGEDRVAILEFAYGGKTAEVPLSQVNTDDYWKDGEMIPLHTHGTMPEGTIPIPVVVVGNGWDLGDHKKGGLWEQFTRGWCELFLAQDMIKPFADYFDVYAYCAISNQSGNIAFSAFKYGLDQDRDTGPIVTLPTYALLNMNHPNALRIVFVELTNGAVGGWNYYYSNAAGGASQIAMYGNPSMEEWGQYWWTHEFIGHDLANMPDYYTPAKSLNLEGEKVPYTSIDWTDNGLPYSYIRTGEYPKCFNNGSCTVIDEIRWLCSNWDNGYWWNTDWETDPEKVVWKDFIGKPGYDNVGVYSGGTTGLGNTSSYKRPEDHNVMNENWGSHMDGNIWHDVGSRFWIYNRILERAGVRTSPHLVTNPDPNNLRSLENFMRFDVENNYNDNGIHTRTYPLPPILTATYWNEHGLFYNSRKWIADATVVVSGPGGRFITVKVGETTLLSGTDYTSEETPGGNFLIIRGIGEYTGSQKIKRGTGYEVLYIGNQNTGGSIPSDFSLYNNGDNVTVLFDPLPIKAGCVFAGWATSATAANATYTQDGTTTFAMGSADVTLYAVWKASVTYDSNGGTQYPVSTVASGSKINAPFPAPVKAGSAFLGWYIDNGSFDTKWNFTNNVVTENLTLYAKWETVEDSEGSVISLNDLSPPASGDGWTYQANIYTINNGANVTIKNTTTTRRIVVAKDATATVTLDNANITSTSSPFQLSDDNAQGSDITLILVGKNTLTVEPSQSFAALTVEGKAKITIQGEGYLNAAGGGVTKVGNIGGSAGIGGSNAKNGGSITITGGNITTSGGYNSASIGGGYSGSGTEINISGGTVIARVIGGGNHGNSGNITISGGTVINTYQIALVFEGTVNSLIFSDSAIVFIGAGNAPSNSQILGNARVRAGTFSQIDEAGNIKLTNNGFDIPEGSTLTVPKGITLDVNSLPFTNNGNIRTYRINNEIQSGGSSEYGDIINWTDLGSGVDRGSINGITSIVAIDGKSVLKIYPNPVKDVLTIEAEAPIKSITVSNLSGLMVVRKDTLRRVSTETISTSKLSEGIYLLTVETEKGKMVKKIIKK